MNKDFFSRVAILGPGLLGGSLAMALRRYLPDLEIHLWGRRIEPLQIAEQFQLADLYTTDLARAVDGCDLIVFATPVGVMLPLATKMLPFLSADVLVTDVGSVKAFVHNQLGAFCAEHSLAFIGSHPMAGSEKQGIEYADADLFDKATVVLTGGEDRSSSLMEKLAHFWNAVGGLCLEMSPEQHDRTVATISHMPHAMAAICSLSAGDCGDTAVSRMLSAGGFRDTTRIAMGEPGMWAEILLENKDEVLFALDHCAQRMEELKKMLQEGAGYGAGADGKIKTRAALQGWLSDARQTRATIVSMEKEERF
ncbi:MAG: prephenate dehydrogenase/arogenate dehydrogenase family protein [Akkermansia sp.]